MLLRKLPWIAAAVAPFALGIRFLASLQSGETQVFMPDQSSHGHYQIEMQCSVCHEEDFQGVKQNACLQCHQEELDRSNDSHPPSKFLDPRNAARVKILDARQCISCHTEHKPEATDSMGVTLPTDYCYFCHQDVATERPSHQDMPFDSCATSGCHNYHDNTALYERFLVSHAHEADFKDNPHRPTLDYYKKLIAKEKPQPLSSKDRDTSQSVFFNQDIVYDWHTTAHAKAGVNCMDCHKDASGKTEWIEHPDHNACRDCHTFETESFLQGRHGMRLAQGLSPMTPEMARLPMKASAAHDELTCMSCHSDHRFDTKFAAMDACMNCHDSAHVKNYPGTSHHQAWLDEMSGKAAVGSGVSCATCHMPRIEHNHFGEVSVRVQHNQNDTLRPNEKMIRSSCLNCHGLEFAIDALADPKIVESNFKAAPHIHIKSIDMALEEAAKGESR